MAVLDKLIRCLSMSYMYFYVLMLYSLDDFMKDA